MTASSSDQNLVSRLGLVPGSVVEGKFRLEELLGAGGGGEVWKAAEALDAEAWRDVALKLLRPSDRGTPQSSSPSTEPQHSFLHEARAVSAVSCEALPRVFSVGVAKSPAVPFIAMELLLGETLEVRLGRGPIHWRKALAIAKHIALALDACHGASVIHCDLKPRNVFLEGSPRQRVLVLDFGVASLGGTNAKAARPAGGDGARTADETDVQESAESGSPEIPAAPPIIGTPAYISPERLTGNLPDPRDDAFALGVVLHRMIAGRLPQRLPAGAETAQSSVSKKRGSESYEIALNRATVERTFEPLQDAAPATPRAVLALVARLLGPASERPAKGQLEELLDEVYRRPHGRPPLPYAGLEAFGERRVGYLPGRASDVEPIVRRLHDQVGLVLCGPSGAGKSSLAVAGVAARVDEEMLLGTEGWVPVVLRPSSARGGLRLATGEAPPLPAGPTTGTFVVVDQLEEVLSLDDDERRAFCRAFAALVLRRAAVVAGDRRIGVDEPVRVVATVREDLFGRVAALPELERLPEQNLYVVRGVDPNAAREIVIDPLEGTGFALEKAPDVDVVADVARELDRDASALPLVQFALARLWDRREPGRHVLPAQAWKDIGGIMGALGEAAQGLFEALDAGDQQTVRRLFLALFEVEGTRNVVDEDSLDAAAIAIVPRLVDTGLVRRRAEEGGRAVIEPLHEALARGWPQLGRWLDEVRADRELSRDAQRDAKRWERNGRPVDLLWGGTLLKNTAVLEAIREEPGRAFVVASREAVAASLAVMQEEELRRARTLRRGALAIVATLLTVLGVALAGWWTTSQAKQRVDDALGARNAALEESTKSERRAKDSEQEALRQKGVAEERRAAAVAAEEKVGKLGKEYADKYQELGAVVERALRERRLEILKDAKKNIDESRPDGSTKLVGRPAASVVPLVGNPFE